MPRTRGSRFRGSRTGGSRFLLLLAVGSVGLAACTGSIAANGGPPGDDDDVRHGTGGSSAAPGGRGGSSVRPGGAGGTEAPTVDDLPWPAALDGKPSKLRRLTRDEIIASMKAIIGAAPARDTLPVDHRSSRHALLDTAGLGMIDSEVQAMSLALDAVATNGAAGVLARSGCATTGQAQRDCLATFARTIAARAFRRPLSSEESSGLAALFATAGVSKSDDTNAVDGLIRAVFFSPSFLYRVEAGTPASAGSHVLTASEIATRLAYLATLGPPDQTLLDAAARLSDPTERARQLDRMLATDAGIAAMTAFVLEHLGSTESRVSEKSAAYQAGLPAGHAGAIRDSAARAIGQALRGQQGTIAAILSTATYADDPAVAPIVAGAGTGAAATGDTAETRRVGLLMHPHVLASHTKENGVSPFVVGAFIRESLLCDPLPAPPAGAAGQARADAPAGSSLREDFEWRTSPSPACAACHSSFSPLGYAFLPFDPMGRWIKRDPSGKPWDLAGTVRTFAGVDLTFDSPRALVERLGQHPQVHGCLAQSAVGWALGRRPSPEEEPLLHAVAAVSARTKGDVAALFRAIVGSPAFVSIAASR